MAVQSSSKGSAAANRDTLGDNRSSTAGSAAAASVLDAKALGFDFSELTPETFDKIKELIQAAQSLKSKAQIEWEEEVERKRIDAERKLEEGLEKETRKEVFEIPKGKGNTYKFIGYDTENYKKIMELGNKADNMEDKTSKEFMDLQHQVFRMTITSSLEKCPDEVIDKLPRREVYWLYLVMKNKNENPLPFDPNV